MENLTSPPATLVNVDAVRKLYFRDTTKGARNRQLLKATIPTGVYAAFKNFLETYVGAGIHRGSGVGSPMVTVAIKMLMAIVAGYRIDDAVEDLKLIVNNQEGRNRILDNIEEIHTLLARIN
jgi:hypothetical protein